jgi:hypothetical protein
MRDIKCPLCHETAQASAWDLNDRARVYCGTVEFDITREGLKKVANMTQLQRIQLRGRAKNQSEGKFFEIRGEDKEFVNSGYKPDRAAPEWLITWSKTIPPA